MSDDRQNLPSASGLERLVLCPGSWNLSRGLPNPDSADSASGTRIHRWLAGHPVELAPEEQDIGDRLKSMETSMVDAWLCQGDLDAPHELVREKRMWLKVDGEPVFSGSPDLVAHHEGRAAVLDYKTISFGEHADSELNYQLLGYAVLVFTNPDVESVDVAILQSGHKPSLCHYDSAALRKARAQVIEWLEAAKKPDAPLNPGQKQCNFCPAKMICPALKKEEAMMLQLPDPANLALLDDEEIAAARDVCGRLTKRMEQVKAEALRRAQERPDAWLALGWEVVIPSGKRKVTDITALAETLVANGADWPQIVAASKISITDVKKIARGATGKKGRELDTFFNGALENTCSKSDGKARLERIGSPEEETEEES